MVGHVKSNEALTNTILIGWHPPDDYNICYYVETMKMLAPNTWKQISSLCLLNYKILMHIYDALKRELL